MNTHFLKHAARLSVLAMVSWAGPVFAQLPMAPSTQFSIVGFLQEATVDNPGDILSGGRLKVNNHVIIVPRNTVVEFPANAISWQQVFAQAPSPYGLTSASNRLAQSGMAMADVPTPLTTYEFNVVGNRVGDTYIAGLIYISQQGLNSGQGFINYIDYAKGEMRVGGVLNDPNTGSRVRINDPNPIGTGKFSKGLSPDIRFTLDPDNPTVRTETGYPMGLPVTDPAIIDDPLRPQKNRPRDGAGNPLSIFTFPDPATRLATDPDPSLQAPFEVGDYITFAGTLVTDNSNAPTMGPLPANGAAGTYVSAHTIIDNLGFYTAPGTVPAYVAIDVTILGTGGITVPAVAEATIRTRFEGFCTDPGVIIDLYGIDLDCTNGAGTDRNWGSVDVDPGPVGRGAVKGRWRFRPPSKVLTLPPSGTFEPTCREVRAVMRGDWTTGQTNLAANGLIYGQYHAPIAAYLFPENITGSPIVPNNFDSSFPWLVKGGQTVIDTNGNPIVVGQLSPFPASTVPTGCGGVAASILPPIAIAGPNQSVLSRAVVTLDGNGSIDPQGLPLAFQWVQTAGTPATLSTPGAAITTFTAPLVPFGGAPISLTFSLIVSNTAGFVSAPSTVNITVNPPGAPGTPIANAGTAQTVDTAVLVTLNGTGSSDPTGLPLTYSWVQTGGTPVTLIGANTALATFTSPNVIASTLFTFQLTVNNGFNSSLPSTVAITVRPVPNQPPTAKAGGNQTVASDTAPVTLNGSASTDPQGLTLTYTWIQTAGPAVTLTSVPTSPLATFTAPHVPFGALPVSLTFQLTVRNSSGLSSAPSSTTVTVQQAALLPPIPNAGAAQTVPSGTPLVTLHGSATDPNNPALPMTFTWTQTAGPAVVLTGATTLTPTFTAPVVGVGRPAVVLTFVLSARNSGGAIAVASTTVTVNPSGITLAITAVEYRTGKERLTVNVTASVVDPNLVVTQTEDAGLNPQPMANLGGGLYQLILTGVPQPTTITVSAPGAISSTAPPPPFRIRL